MYKKSMSAGMSMSVWRQSPVADVVMGGYVTGFRWCAPFTEPMTIPYAVMYRNARGRATIDVGDVVVDLEPGQTLCIAAGQRVRRIATDELDHAWLHLQLAPTYVWSREWACLADDSTLGARCGWGGSVAVKQTMHMHWPLVTVWQRLRFNHSMLLLSPPTNLSLLRCCLSGNRPVGHR